MYSDHAHVYACICKWIHLRLNTDIERCMQRLNLFASSLSILQNFLDSLMICDLPGFRVAGKASPLAYHSNIRIVSHGKKSAKQQTNSTLWNWFSGILRSVTPDNVWAGTGAGHMRLEGLVWCLIWQLLAVWLDIQKKIFATEINQNDQNAVVLSGPLSEPKPFSETVLWHMDAYGSNLELSSAPMGHSILKEGLFTDLSRGIGWSFVTYHVKIPYRMRSHQAILAADSNTTSSSNNIPVSRHPFQRYGWNMVKHLSNCDLNQQRRQNFSSPRR